MLAGLDQARGRCDAVVLIDHQIKGGLPGGSTASVEDGRTNPAATDDLHPLDVLFPESTRKIMGEPAGVMAPFHQGGQVTERHPFGPPCAGVFRISPIKHQKPHDSRLSPGVSLAYTAHAGRALLLRAGSGRNG